ncbi:MAG: DNA mismatch repair protein MutS [Tenericutes bacterium]|nr:DNA mismatch repair protein MutS [Mycoplasmatota bacterium]
MKRSEVDKNKISPMMLQYLNIKEKYEDTIIFFRLGDFYEMFFEDAITASRELELTLTGKNCGLDERVPMCGIPFHAYKNYLDKLIEKGYKVAICEQLTDPKETKGMVERDVIQVVTRGTILDDSLNSKDYNYIGNIYDFEYCYGVSFIDVSTGYSYAIILEHDQDQVIKEILNYNLKEVIVNDKIDRAIISILREQYNILVTIQDNVYDSNEYDYMLSDIKDIRINTTVKHLLYYLVETKKGNLSHLQKVELVDHHKHLLFDVHTKKNLELVETIRNQDRTYSLLWLLDKTKTAMGSRCLKQNIENPLTDYNEINRRYNIIEKFLTEFILKEELREELDKVYDLERLSSRISYGNSNARDMTQLKNSLIALPNIKKILDEVHYDKNIETLTDLYDLLEKSINPDGPIGLHEGGLIKEGYNSELDELKSIRKNSKDFILKIENEERERTGIKNLKIGYNKVFGYYIEVSKGNVNQIKEEYGWTRKQTLTTGERYITPLLKEKEDIILGAEEKIINLEFKLFTDIREIAKSYIPRIQAISKTLAEVDMLLAFAVVSEENSYVKPILTLDNVIQIKDGRHPVVEKVSKGEYVSNDIIMGKDTNILLITGPNMAGKSTYMRQLAITVIMAQIGCFVPCKSCIIPIFDSIFTRIGASDDLVSGESTFMVEMKEANTAIQNATKNSLILFDELGRGTATYDGMSLAQAILEYIHDKIGAKTLFSTHYHELTSLANELPHLRNVHVSAIEEDKKITFLHKIKNGAVDKSYGIHVASLAHLPDELIKRADEILDVYEHKNVKKQTFTQTSLFLDTDDTTKEKEDENQAIIDKLKEIKPLEMTPMEALNLLYELKNELVSKK